MNLIVSGGRNWNRPKILHAALRHLGPAKIIHGDCPTGTDHHADQWARWNHVERDPLPAEWSDMTPPCRVKYGRHGPYNALAGFKRNSQLLTRGGSALLATEGGPGTMDMLDKAWKAGLPIWRVLGSDLHGPGGDVVLSLVGEMV